jgi:tetratricopeptide (TPR) repeat protein
MCVLDLSANSLSVLGCRLPFRSRCVKSPDPRRRNGIKSTVWRSQDLEGQYFLKRCAKRAEACRRPFRKSHQSRGAMYVNRSLAVLIVTACLTLRADEAHHHYDPAQKVGRVSLTISCSQSAQNKVEYGLALMHSFLFEDAEDQFKNAATADPTCAMAYWAEAIGLYRPLAYLPTNANMKRGWELIQKAIELDPKTPRERDYVQAAAALYRMTRQTLLPSYSTGTKMIVVQD